MKGAAPPRTASKSCHLSLQTHCLLHGFPVPRSPSACRARAAESRSRSRAVAFRVSCVAEAVRPTFSDVKTEKEFLEVLTLALRHPRAPDFLLPAFQDFFNNYKAAVLGSGVSGADEERVVQVMAAIADRTVHEFVDPFTFPSHHTRIQEPYDYYAFGQVADRNALKSGKAVKWAAPVQNYVRNLIDYSNSVVGNLHVFDRIEALLAKGDNVVMLANHQTEADPAVWALLLERTHPRLATDVHYVAGDRVVSDPLCKPFSMGRNLFCVHSKKHLDDIPELKEEKVRTNRQTLVAMSRQLNKGGLLMWIAPSGGRDRPNNDMVWMPDKFDPSAVELMRTLLARAKPEGHLFPLAMHSGEMMPPPKSKEKSLGERRLTYFVGTGLSAGEELDVDSIVKDVPKDNPKASQAVLAEAAYNAVTEEYLRVEEAIRNPSKRAEFAQPWLS